MKVLPQSWPLPWFCSPFRNWSDACNSFTLQIKAEDLLYPARHWTGCNNPELHSAFVLGRLSLPRRCQLCLKDEVFTLQDQSQCPQRAALWTAATKLWHLLRSMCVTTLLESHHPGSVFLPVSCCGAGDISGQSLGNRESSLSYICWGKEEREGLFLPDFTAI